MNYRNYGLALAIIATMGASAHAEPNCQPTRHIATSHYPGAAQIQPTNNLLLPIGKSIEAEGQRLIVHGRVLDAHCMPIAEATVELWQVDPFGKWILAEADDVATPHPTFTGAGRAITDSNGEFIFTTAFPGAVVYRASRGQFFTRAPQLNLKIKPEGMDTFSTVLFFANDRRNADDLVYSKLDPAARSSVTLSMSPPSDPDLVGTINLILPNGAPYRTY